MKVQIITIWGGFIQARRNYEVSTIAIIVQEADRQGAIELAKATALDRFPIADGWSGHAQDLTGQILTPFIGLDTQRLE